MKKITNRNLHHLFLATFFLLMNGLLAQVPNWQTEFKNPPLQYYPAPLWHLNGSLSDSIIDAQIDDMRNISKFGGVTPLPLSETKPRYLTDDYFKAYSRILQDAKKNGLQVIWYDDSDFPSGCAGREMYKHYPNDTRKILYKKDTTIAANTFLSMNIPSGTLMSAVAMNTDTKGVQNIMSSVKDKKLIWQSSQGNWKVMVFTCDTVRKKNWQNDYVVDYLDTAAVHKYIHINNEQFAKRYKQYFGTTIKQIFFDDVGFFTGVKHGERTWTDKFNNKFTDIYKSDPVNLYPALWEDIGVNTAAARIAFFNTRAELLAEGFPKSTADWCSKNGILSSGHPPGNYDIQPTDMNGDIIKYYRHQQVPLMDLIFYHGHGRAGYKLISAAAALYDRPMMAAEIYGAFGMGIGGEKGTHKLDRKMLYQSAMEVFIRGVNFLIPHGMWLDPDSSHIHIPPLISAYSHQIGPELPDFNTWAARTCLLLQGGRSVSDIAVLYPIASLQAGFSFDLQGEWGKSVPQGTDYLDISDMLTNEVHRDFTFIHPESLVNQAIKIFGNKMILENKVNRQEYKILIIPGGKVISANVLQIIKTFFDQGGKIISTSVLPSQSAEFGRDAEVVKMVKEIFNVDPTIEMPKENTSIKTNSMNGKAIFIPKPNAEELSKTLDSFGVLPDVAFMNNPHPLSANGMFSYIHKIKDGKHIYFFANSTDEEINTFALVRGKIKPMLYNPYDGSISEVSHITYEKKNNEIFTKFFLSLKPVNSCFIIDEN